MFRGRKFALVVRGLVRAIEFKAELKVEADLLGDHSHHVCCAEASLQGAAGPASVCWQLVNEHVVGARFTHTVLHAVQVHDPSNAW